MDWGAARVLNPLMLVFATLSPWQLAKVSCVCKAWRRIALRNILWKQHLMCRWKSFRAPNGVLVEEGLYARMYRERYMVCVVAPAPRPQPQCEGEIPPMDVPIGETSAWSGCGWVGVGGGLVLTRKCKRTVRSNYTVDVPLVGESSMVQRLSARVTHASVRFI